MHCARRVGPETLLRDHICHRVSRLGVPEHTDTAIMGVSTAGHGPRGGHSRGLRDVVHFFDMGPNLLRTTARLRARSPVLTSFTRGGCASRSCKKERKETKMASIPRRCALLILGLAATLAGCVRAPDTVYLVDKKTVLEHQASGEFRVLENDLNDSAIKPRGETFTGAELEASGVSAGGASVVAQLYATTRSDDDRLDELLVRKCVGEANTGLLEETPSNCVGTVEAEEVSRLVQRANRNRRQVWAYIVQQTPGATEEDVKEKWRVNHLKSLICGGQIQGPKGAWDVKKCE